MSSCSSCERTFVILKPDAVQRGLVGEILMRFERRGLKIVAAKLLTATPEILSQHYHEHTSKGFYKGLVTFMTSGPILTVVLEGPSVVSATRTMMGTTNPATSAPGTIRGDLAIDINSNIVHGSDSITTAESEIALWFPELSKHSSTHDCL